MTRLKTILLAGTTAAALSIGAAGVAQATMFIGPSPKGTQSNDVFDTKIEGWYGAQLYLFGPGPAQVEVYYLGKEAGYQNQFNLWQTGDGPPNPPLITDTRAPDTSGTQDYFPSPPQPAPPLLGTVTLNPGLLSFNFVANLLGTPMTVWNGLNAYVAGKPNFFLTFTSGTPFDLASWDTTINNVTPGSGTAVIIALDDTGAGPDDNHDDHVILLVLKGPGTFQVPEPASLALLGAGLLGLGYALRRRRTA